MTGTTRFGLTLGAKLSDRDIQLLDRLLGALELHDHSGGDQLADPAGPPTAVLATTGGSLPAGTTFYYRLSLVDQFGLETAASSEVSVTTPSAVAAPSFPTVTVLSSGGVLGVGTYYYALTSVDSVGNETPLSTPVATAVTVANSRVSVLGQTVFPTGAVAYGVYRRGPRVPGYTKIGTITDPTLPFVDTGSVADDPLARDISRLPSANKTSATSMVTLGPSTSDLTRTSVSGGPVKAWRLYRATSSGAYSASSLLTEMNYTVNPDGTGGLLSSFVDDGTLGLSSGSPLDTSQALHPSVLLGGGQPVIAVLTLAGPTTKWRLAADATGALQLVTTDTLVGSGDLYLSSPGHVWWKVTADDNGGLTTTAGAPGLGDRAYLAERAPLLPTSDPGISYLLTVSDDGALTTASVGSTIPS